MAKKPADVIPDGVRELAKYLDVPEPDWYVGSLESGVGGSLHDKVRSELKRQDDAPSVGRLRRRKRN
jgi:hypothetical protein